MCPSDADEIVNSLDPDLGLHCLLGGHWSGKSQGFDFSSGSGKSQGILQIGQGNFKYQESRGKVREFHNFDPKYVL